MQRKSSQVKFSSETIVFFLLKTVFQFRLAQSNQEPHAYISSSPVTSDGRVHFRKVYRLAQDVVAAAWAGPVGVACTRGSFPHRVGSTR